MSPTDVPTTSPSRIPAIVALAAALTFAVLLGVRPVASPDIGYHLDYGEQFLRTGHIVDHNDNYVYTLADAAKTRPDPGPGCWYEPDGQYRFPNANWLTQVIFAAVFRAGGYDALSLLLAVLVATFFAMLTVAMLRMGLSPLWAAVGVGFVAMVSYERFMLRPEMFSYLLLATQLAILLPNYRRFCEAVSTTGAPPGPKAKPQAVIGWKTIAAMALIQLLMVNLHSYFMLALLPTGAMFLDAAARQGWLRLGHKPSSPLAASQSRRLGILLAIQLALCFANPWTWRLALLPVQTLLFLKANHVGAEFTTLAHPWQVIGEFWGPFESSFGGMKATTFYCLMLGLAVPGVLAALWRRRWAAAMLITEFVGVSLAMRRNIPVGATVVIPLALASIADFVGSLKWQFGSRPWRGLRWGLALGVTGISIVAAVTVVTNGFYCAERSYARFGMGAAGIDIPTGPANWIRKNLPDCRRIWTDFATSSNFHWLTGCEVPWLTNTWAYPPAVMNENLKLSLQPGSFPAAAAGHGIEVVAIRVDNSLASWADYEGGLRSSARSLASDLATRWTMVYFDGIYAVFIRPDGPLAKTAAQFALQTNPQHLSAELSQSIRNMDPRPEFSLHLAGLSFYVLGWDAAAIDAFEQCISAYGTTYFRTYNMAALCLARRGTARASAGDPDFVGAKADWTRAKLYFQKALDTCSEDASRGGIAANINLVTSQLQALQRGVVLLPRM